MILKVLTKISQSLEILHIAIKDTVADQHTQCYSNEEYSHDHMFGIFSEIEPCL